MDKFDGQAPYAFAAYNAGDNRVTDWQGIGKYHGMDEFVESIPFTETREYVQAILRNESIYRELNGRELTGRELNGHELNERMPRAQPSAVAQPKTVAAQR